MRWSVEGQTAEYLAATRMISLSDTIVGTVLGKVPLVAGMRVLDVGCGSGELCFRLGASVQGVRFTGVEIDGRFVSFARRRAAGEVGYPFEVPSRANEYRFAQGDGIALPFDDGSFHAVVSHTYLTAVTDWRKAIDEMKRVCKPGGIVASITSLTGDFYGTGSVELFSSPVEEGDRPLFDRVAAAKAATFGYMDLTAGIPPRLVPAAFCEAGFDDVQCVPLGHYFCLSDSAVSEFDYRRYVGLLRAVELEELERVAPAISESDRRGFAELIERRCGELLDKCGRNRDWDWYGNASLLVRGVAPAS